MDDHRQKYVEITKGCLWNELQNYCLGSTGKKISLSAIMTEKKLWMITDKNM